MSTFRSPGSLYSPVSNQDEKAWKNVGYIQDYLHLVMPSLGSSLSLSSNFNG